MTGILNEEQSNEAEPSQTERRNRGKGECGAMNSGPRWEK